MSEEINAIDQVIAKVIVKVADGSVDGDTPYSESCSKIKRLSSEMQNALLGLLAGFSPIITVQQHSVTNAELDWDTKYSYNLKKQLNGIRRVLPINTAAVLSIAKNVYVSRSTLALRRIEDNLFWALMPTIVLTDDNAGMHTVHYCLMECYNKLSRLWVRLDDIPPMGPQLMDAVKSIAIGQLNETPIEYTLQDITNYCCKFISIGQWILNPSTYVYKDLKRQVIFMLFAKDILTLRTVDTLHEISFNEFDKYPQEVLDLLDLGMILQWKI